MHSSSTLRSPARHPRRDTRVRTVALIIVLLCGSDAGAQASSRDTARTRSLDTVVVTAERTGAPLATSAAAVTRLDAGMLRRLPAQTVSAALELVPGIAVLHSDALGDAPRLAIRGFYGGGETEYVTVLLDGVPLTGLATGQVNWDLVPLSALESIEVVRGGSSALYGDAAVGGVVNLVTRRDQRFATWRASAGAFGVVRAGAALGGTLGERQAGVFGDVRHSTGYRDHEARTSGTLGGSLALASTPTRTLTLSTLNHRRVLEEPGPLTGAALAQSRRAVSGFYRFDETADQLHRLTLDGTALLGGGRRLSGYLTAEYARTDAVRTVPLAPDFADTKDRALRTGRVVGSVQLEKSGLLAGVPSRIVAGTDLAAGRLTSRYAPVAQGDLAAYAAASGADGDVDAKGSGSRTSAAGFASWELVPAEALRLTLGGRVDWIEDRYTPQAPTDGATIRATRAAFSPRAGLNLRYVNGARQTGNLYLSAGRSFKAPTIDQLFDQRTTPVPFPPYTITTSNTDLRAQYGTSVEAGAYHRIGVIPGTLDARLNVSAYQIDMNDELDFDLQQFKYVNIGRSRHRGVEAGLTVSGPSATSAFANFTQQDATSRFGDNAGRFLKAVPRHVLSAGLAHAPASGLSIAGTVSSVRDIYIDDANTLELDPYTRVDLRASCPVLGSRVSLSVQNLLDRSYSTTAFTDPSGSGAIYYYPAAGRLVSVGVESHW